VRLINLGDNETLAGLETIVEPEDENGNGHANGGGNGATRAADAAGDNVAGEAEPPVGGDDTPQNP
jgi:hypothetical protein